MNRVLPESASNKYQFSPVIVCFFWVIASITIVRSLIHMLAADGGANSIAGIVIFSGTPDPNQVLYFAFSLWGLSQLLMGIFYIIVVFRYRNLIPLMLLFLSFEYSMRMVLGKFLKPLSDAYFTGTVPGEIGNYILLPLALVLFTWAIAGPLKPKTKNM